MLKNYFKTTWRSLTKNRIFSLINVLGLTIGITVCLMIFLFIKNEFGFDSFHKDGDRIYRVMRGFKDEGKAKEVAYLSGLYAPALQNDFGADLESIVRVIQNDNLVTIDDQSFREKKVLDVDNNFFSFFSFPLVVGDAKTVLSEPHSVVLTEGSAKKYFGTVANAVGKTVILDKDLPLKVTGIARDLPSNSTIEFDMVVPIENYKDISIMTVWINNGLHTYLKLSPGVAPKQLESRFPAFMEKYMGSDMRKFGFNFTLSLMPLKNVYFASDAFDNNRHGDKTMAFIFLSVAILVLLVACINFMNLSTIRAVERAREVGMRKVLGAMRRQLIGQFLGESVFIALIACLLAIGVVFLTLPWYNELIGYQLSISIGDWQLWSFLLAVIITVGLLAGSYPAFVLSAFRPIEALRGRLKLGSGGAIFRQFLVVLQFSISVFLITAIIVIARQMVFLKNKGLGYNQEQIVMIPVDNKDLYQNINLFKRMAGNNNNVVSLSLMSGEPGGFFDSHMFDVEDQTGRVTSRTEFADFEFVRTLGLNIIAGRDFSPAFPTDSLAAAIINNTFAQRMGWTPEEAVGKWIHNTVRDSTRRQIVGVVRDFNFQSLKSDIEPLVIAPRPDWRVILIKLKPGNISSGIRTIEKDFSQIAPGYPMEYRFLDDQFDHLYKKDLRQQTVLTIFAILAIFIASLGLFGLSAFTIAKKTKEIGIRKVLGASAGGIVVWLSKDLLKPVFIATCIALPAGYWAVSQWMDNFAYKATLPWWIFVLAVMVTFLIAFFTVGFKSFKAAGVNPAKSLKSE